MLWNDVQTYLSSFDAVDFLKNFAPAFAAAFLGVVLGIPAGVWVNSIFDSHKKREFLRELKTALEQETNDAIGLFTAAQQGDQDYLYSLSTGVAMTYLNSSASLALAPPSLTAAIFEYHHSLAPLNDVRRLYLDATQDSDDNWAQAVVRVRRGASPIAERALHAAHRTASELERWRP